MKKNNAEVKKEEQIVYVLMNEAMPDYVKIGKTNNLQRRIQDLDWTNMPLPFVVYYAATVDDSAFTEKQLHSIFADNRARSNREFFKVNPERIVAAIKMAEIKNITPKNPAEHNPDVKEELERIYKKRFDFSAVKIPVGSELVFTRDESIRAKVAPGSNIEVDGKIFSLSKAAQNALGVDYPVQGPIFWMYKDETLDERRRRMEEEAAG